MFSRPLIAYGIDTDPAPIMALLRALSPSATRVRLLLSIPETGRVSLSDSDLRSLERELSDGDDAISLVHRACSVEGLEVEGEVVVDPVPTALADAIGQHDIDLVVLGSFTDIAPETVAAWAIETVRAQGVTATAGGLPSGSLTRFVCPFDGHAESLSAVAAFLRDRCTDRHAATLLSLGPLDSRLLADRTALSEVAGIHAKLDVEALEGGWLGLPHALDAITEPHETQAILLSSEVGSGTVVDVLARMSLRTLSRGKRPLVFVPRVVTKPLVRDGALDALDVLAPAHVNVTLRLERIGGLGRPAPIADDPVAVVFGGAHVATLFAHAGRLVVDPSLLPDRVTGLGLGRGDDGGDPLGTLETSVSIEWIGDDRVTLVDSRLDAIALQQVRRTLEGEGRDLYAVRLAPDEAARDIRARWSAAGFAKARTLDVRDLLHEGDAQDVPADVAAVRLCRAAARLRARGAFVDSVVTLAPVQALGAGFAVVPLNAIDEASHRIAAAYLPPPAPGTLAGRLDMTSASRVITGNRLRVDLDNGDALRALVALIDGARARLHAQWYIVEDDEITRTVEQALMRAGERGVDVRVLVDSLYSMHGSFGAENTLLLRLGQAKGVELRVSRPIDHVPSLADLKQRDHRKIATADGARGIVSGRNLGQTYYRAFETAKLHRDSPWADVPWLDASVSIEGPAVASIDACFLGNWRESGGTPFDILPVPVAGDSSMRLVVHHGLSDAYTLETYLALVDSARERLCIVNSFPLQLEMQHTLLRAISRGVSVTLFVGRARPSWGDDVPFAGGAYRSIADALVRARLDCLVEAGAEVRELAMTNIESWDVSLGFVHPPVHAKMLCADRRHLAIGSANLDVTAGYWESEALVVVDDPALALSVEARLETLFATSRPIDARDPKWRKGSGLRAWLGRVWPSVLG